jgi:O-antigen ligase
MAYALVLVLGILAAVLSWKDPKSFLLLVLLAGPLQIGQPLGEALGGTINLSAIWLLALLVLGLLALTSRASKLSQPPSAPEVTYLLFLAWCVVRAAGAEDVGFAARMVAKLAFPFVVLCLARRFIIRDEDRFRLMRLLAMTAAVVVAIGGGLTQYVASTIARTGRFIFIDYAALADYTTMMALAALVSQRLFQRRAYIWLYVLLAASPVFYAIRTGIVATTAGSLAFFFSGASRIKGAVLGALVYAAAVTSLFVLPSAAEHMFYRAAKVDPSAVALNPTTLDLGTVDSSGRFAMWKWVLDTLFWPSPVSGSGLGACQKLLYSGARGRVRVVHNEYVRLLADVGVVGVGLLAVFVVTCVVCAWWTLTRGTTPGGRACAHAALAMLVAWSVAMYVDNLLDYVLFATQYPFAFVGMMGDASPRHPGGWARQPAPQRTIWDGPEESGRDA